jgi:DNA processing protein
MARDSAATDWLIAIRAPQLGARRLRAALIKHGDIATLRALARRRQSGLPEVAESYLSQPDEAQLAADLAWLSEPSHHLIHCKDDWFPAMLAQAKGAPAALFVVGDPAALWQPQIAMVGSRKASPQGMQIAADFATELARRGFAITSGMAVGIDASAHRAALAAGAATVAVLGTGPDICYPSQHHELAQAIAAQGALVSEWPPGTKAHSGHFPARNRVISGLALGVLVVEASLRSGSLITARQAAEQGREVMAVPGPVYHAQSQGCHQLIREGAKLVANVQQVIEDVQPLAGRLAHELRQALDDENPSSALESGRARPQVRHSQVHLSAAPSAATELSASNTADTPDLSDLDAEYLSLLQALGAGPLVVDDIVEATNLTPEAVSSMLLILELRGLVVCHGGANWSRHHEIVI